MADHSYTNILPLIKEMENINNIDSVENVMDSVENVGDYTKEGDELLIDLIRSYPHLWNKQDQDYKDINKCDNTWQEIANIMKQPVKDCQNRWCRLRQYYSKERQNQENMPSGSAPNKKRPWELYEQMSFIDQHIIKRRRKYTNIKSTGNESSQLQDLSQRSSLSDITNKDTLEGESSMFTTPTATLPTELSDESTSSSSSLQFIKLSQQSTPLFRKNKNKTNQVDPLEKSLNTVSQSISAIANRMFTNEDNNRDEALTKMILAELKNSSEPKKKEFRQKLLNVLMEYMVQ